MRMSLPIDWNLVSSDVLKALDVDKLVATAGERQCFAYSEAISPLFGEPSTLGSAQLTSLRFVSATLLMSLRAEQPAEPFGPMFVFGERRSPIPSDFPRDSLLSLGDWALSLKDPELRARFLDLIWTQAKSFPSAQGAINAYIESAINLEDPKAWPPCLERFERALRIAASLGKANIEARNRVLMQIEAALERHAGKDPLYLTLRLSRLLLEFHHGNPTAIARFANTGAERAEVNGEFWRARDYFQLAADCHQRSGDVAAQGSSLRQAAEALAKEAEAALTQPGRGAIAAASILAQAVDAMRQAPEGKERSAALHERMLALQPNAVSEMRQLSTEVDATTIVEKAIGTVRGKSFRDAVISMCHFVRPPKIEQLIAQVHEQAKSSVFGSLIHADIVNFRGKVVARVPPLTYGIQDLKDDGLRARMFQSARLERGLKVQAMMNPARQEIVSVHNPNRQDVIELIRNSPWIPPGHSESVVRALLVGFHGDMIVLAHLLPPQFEAVLRHIVESMGGTTSMLEPGRIQPERPIASLLESEEAERALGRDAVFELQDLLADSLGTNLRNEIAHGLLEDDCLFGSDVLYAWWLMLRFLMLTSLIAERQCRPLS